MEDRPRDPYKDLERRSVQASNAGIEAFASERVELSIVIVVLAFMLSIIDESFRFGMYAIIGIALLLLGYNYTQRSKPVGEPLSPKEDKTSESLTYNVYTDTGGEG